MRPRLSRMVSDRLIPAKLLDPRVVVAKLAQDFLRMFPEIGNRVEACGTVRKIQRAADRGHRSHGGLDFSDHFPGDRLRVSQNLGDASHHAVGKLDYFQTAEPFLAGALPEDPGNEF